VEVGLSGVREGKGNTYDFNRDSDVTDRAANACIRRPNLFHQDRYFMLDGGHIIGLDLPARDGKTVTVREILER